MKQIMTIITLLFLSATAFSESNKVETDDSPKTKNVSIVSNVKLSDEDKENISAALDRGWLGEFADKVEFQVDVGHTQLEHHWAERRAYFDPQMNSIGVTAWHESDFGLRLAMGFMKSQSEQTGGPLKHIRIHFKHIASLEVMYRHFITNSKKCYLFGGIGTYKIPLNQTYHDENGEVYGGRPDADDDEGYFGGANCTISDKLGVQFRWTKYSKIDDADEHIEGKALEITYTFD